MVEGPNRHVSDGSPQGFRHHLAEGDINRIRAEISFQHADDTAVGAEVELGADQCKLGDGGLFSVNQNLEE